jgi:hypothetical protein
MHFPTLPWISNVHNQAQHPAHIAKSGERTRSCAPSSAHGDCTGRRWPNPRRRMRGRSFIKAPLCRSVRRIRAIAVTFVVESKKVLIHRFNGEDLLRPKKEAFPLLCRVEYQCHHHRLGFCQFMLTGSFRLIMESDEAWTERLGIHEL